MKVILLYVTLISNTIWSMEEYQKIKELLAHPRELTAYLESQDQHLNTPLMRLLDKATDDQLNELLPLLKDVKFNLEIKGPAQETAFFNACDRKTIVGAVLMTYLGAKIDTQTPAGRPVDLAFYNDNLALLKYLLYEGQKTVQITETTHDAASRFSDFPEFRRILAKTRRKIPSLAQKVLLKVIGPKIKKKAYKKS